MPQAIHEARKRVYQFYQAPNMLMQTYCDCFIHLVDVIEHIGGAIGVEPGILKDMANKKSKDKTILKECVGHIFRLCARSRLPIPR